MYALLPKLFPIVELIDNYSEHKMYVGYFFSLIPDNRVESRCTKVPYGKLCLTFKRF